jgi:hypothetical protein
MASLCLTNSELHVGLDWSGQSAAARALSDRTQPPILLYPGAGAKDLAREPPPGPVTLVVVDGTWAQTKTVLRKNPRLAALPRYAFVPSSPSDYRIRREPTVECVATIEALVHALSALEDGRSFESLLAPFRRMIDFQLACEAKYRGAPSRHAQRRGRIRHHGVPRLFRARLADLVCVTAEANAWPYSGSSGSSRDREDELVHWAAFRPATGETLDVVVAPSGEIAPGTTKHTGLDPATLRAGTSLGELHARWSSWSRPTDVIVAWGGYATSLFERSGGVLPATRLDLRRLARNPVHAHVHVQVPVPMPDREIEGRAGRKLRALAEVVAQLRSRM